MDSAEYQNAVAELYALLPLPLRPPLVSVR